MAEKKFAARTAVRKKAAPVTIDYDMVPAELERNWLQITQQRAKVQAVFDEYHDELFSHPDVCGLHVGLKRTGGRVCYPLNYCIRLHVRRKWAVGHPMLEHPIDPDQFKESGIELDIMQRSYQTVPARVMRGASPPLAGPMLGGRPIAPDGFADHWGTMGMVVFFGGQPHYLTNRHVAGVPGTLVRESDQGLTCSGRTGIIGEVVAGVRDTMLDCALIAPTGKRRLSMGIINRDEPDGVLSGFYVPRKLTSVDEHRTHVFKIGARTGFNPILAGVVKNVNTSIEVSGQKMRGQIVVESTNEQRIIGPGDSGAMAIVRARHHEIDVNFVVGLVHAETEDPDKSESGHGMIANHFDRVESALRISLFPT